MEIMEAERGGMSEAARRDWVDMRLRAWVFLADFKNNFFVRVERMELRLHGIQFKRLLKD